MIDFYIKKGDTVPSLQSQLQTYDESNINLSGASVHFNYKLRHSGDVVSRTALVYSEQSGLVEYAWVSGDTETAGLYNAEFVVTFSDSSQMTFPPNGPFVFEVVEDIS